MAESEYSPDKLDEDGFIGLIKRNTRRAIRATSAWNKTAKEDFRFCLGDQWDQADKAILDSQGRPHLVINQIKVQVKTITGHQRTNASRIRANPEGEEDKAFSEAIDKALSHINKKGKLEFKLNNVFDDGTICGKGCIELFLDYDDDPLHGELDFASHGPFVVYKDPDSVEYDLSDADFCVKVQRFTKEKLAALYPKAKAKIADLKSDTGVDDILAEVDIKKEGDSDNYGNNPGGQKPIREVTLSEDAPDEDDPRGRKYTLLEYWYRKYVPKFFTYDLLTGATKRHDTEEEAIAAIQEQVKLFGPPMDPMTGQPQMVPMPGQVAPGAPAPLQDNMSPAGATLATGMQPPAQPAPPSGMGMPPPMQVAPPADPEAFAVVSQMQPIERMVPEMHLCAVAGGIKLASGPSPMEPRYTGFPFFFYHSEWYPSAENEEQRVQGLVRVLKDPQKEINKARSQYLHIINTSANSGWLADSDALSPNEFNDLEKFGSRPGIVIKKQPGSQLERLTPVPLPIAQQVREQASTANMKEVSGVNADLLAVQDKTASGRALAQRVKQALTIVAASFENWNMTKQLLGEAIFKLMPEILDARKLSRIVGQTWMKTNMVDEGGLGVMLQTIEDGLYDVYIADSTESPTLRDEMFEKVMEMVQAGVPFPPDVLIELSNIPNAKEVITKMQAYQQQQMQMAALAPQPSGKAGGSNGRS